MEVNDEVLSGEGGDEVIKSGVLVWEGVGRIRGRKGVQRGHISVCDGLGWSEWSKSGRDVHRERREEIKEIGSIVGFWEDRFFS